MKAQLQALYNEKLSDFNQVVSKFPSEKLHGPFLISPNNNYQDSQKKLLVIGQETNKWFSHFNDIEMQMSGYSSFNVGFQYNRTPFWNVIRKLESTLQINALSCAWANINKFDVNSKRPTGQHEKFISSLDHIIVSEIEILKPDICVFFTGPVFDYRLESIFSELAYIKIADFEIHQLCMLKHPNLPEHTYRTYHPRYLRMKQYEVRVLDYFKKVSEFIRS